MVPNTGLCLLFIKKFIFNKDVIRTEDSGPQGCDTLVTVWVVPDAVKEHTAFISRIMQ